MNIFNKVALQGLKKNRTRTLVTIIGVVLSAAMITAVTTFGVSLMNYMTNGAIIKYGDWHVQFWMLILLLYRNRKSMMKLQILQHLKILAMQHLKVTEIQINHIFYCWI